MIKKIVLTEKAWIDEIEEVSLRGDIKHILRILLICRNRGFKYPCSCEQITYVKEYFSSGIIEIENREFELMIFEPTSEKPNEYCFVLEEKYPNGKIKILSEY